MTCKNCNHSLTENAHFCLSCGEKTTFKRLTVTSILSTFFSLLIDIDNKIYKTYIDLFKTPEIVIDAYIKGFRKQYVNVISYVGLTLTLIGLQFFILKRYFPELLVIENMPSSNLKGLDIMNDIISKVFDYYGALTVISIPIYAMVSRLLFSDSEKYNFAEHIIINAYTLAQIFITFFFFTLISIPFKVNYQSLSFLTIPLSAIYSYWFFKRLFTELNTINIIIRVIAFLIFTTIAVVVLGFFIAFLYGIYMGYIGQMEIPSKTIN